MGTTGRNGKKGRFGFRLGPSTDQEPGELLRLHKSSRRTLESWANHYGFKHDADALPIGERAEFYRARLYELQRQGLGPLVGQKMKRVEMSKSDWPNKTYKKRVQEEKDAAEREARLGKLKAP
ncbi:hypothetical protein MKEN_00208600 [Mycena kentingensis (nom. inval.)]|nr:hypothetical protein MKEN_00208600 [Mycena kentingensis (nom. inval.)]